MTFLLILSKYRYSLKLKLIKFVNRLVIYFYKSLIIKNIDNNLLDL